jgi:hypothetical protein
MVVHYFEKMGIAAEIMDLRIAAGKAVFDPQPVPCCARSRAAPNSGTSWRSSPGSIRKPVPPPAGSSPQQKQTIEPLHKSPLQTSPAALPNRHSEKVSPESGRVFLRHAAAKCRPTIAPPRTLQPASSTTKTAVIFCEMSNPTKRVIDEPPTARITGRHRPDRGTIGRSSTNRDYRVSRHDDASTHR